MKKKKRKNQAAAQPTKKSSVMQTVIALLVCVPFLLIGFAFIRIGIKELADLKPYTAETKGIVSDVTKNKIKKNAGFGYYITYTAHYSYEVDDRTFTDTLESTNRIKEGKILGIRYNPDNPKENYVKWYDTAGSIFLLIWGIVWEGAVLLVVCLIINMYRRERAAKKQENAGK